MEIKDDISQSSRNSQDRLGTIRKLSPRALFVTAFFLGLIPIAVTAASSSLNLVLFFGVILPLILLVAYWAIGKSTTLAIEQQESFADSVYYLGFLFTLASLFAALFSLKDSDPNLGMLAARFGLALLTTIIGLLIRVSIVNFERDMDDEQRRAQESLTKGVDQFQAEVERLTDHLQIVLRGIGDQTRELGQQTIDITKEQLKELRRQSEVTHQEFTASNGQLLAESSKKFNEAVELMHDSLLSTLNEANESIKAAAKGTSAVFEALQEAPKAYQKRTEQNIASLEEAQNNLSRIIASQGQIAEKLQNQSEASARITAAMSAASGAATKQLQNVAEAGQQAEAAVTNLSQCFRNLTALDESLQAFERTLTRVPTEIDPMVSEIRSAIQEIAELGRSGEQSLRKLQQNLIDSADTVVRHLGQQ